MYTLAFETSRVVDVVKVLNYGIFSVFYIDKCTGEPCKFSSRSYTPPCDHPSKQPDMCVQPRLERGLVCTVNRNIKIFSVFQSCPLLINNYTLTNIYIYTT